MAAPGGSGGEAEQASLRRLQLSSCRRPCISLQQLQLAHESVERGGTCSHLRCLVIKYPAGGLHCGDSLHFWPFALNGDSKPKICLWVKEVPPVFQGRPGVGAIQCESNQWGLNLPNMGQVRGSGLMMGPQPPFI